MDDKRSRVAGCCEGASTTPDNASCDEGGIREVLNELVASPGEIFSQLCNNNTQPKPAHIFAKKEAVELEFRDLRFSTISVNFRGGIRIGKYGLFLHCVSSFLFALMLIFSVLYSCQRLASNPLQLHLTTLRVVLLRFS